MPLLPELGRRVVVATLAAAASIGIAVTLAAPAAAAPAGAAPAGISFLTAPPAAAVVGGSYAVRVSGSGASTPVVLSTQSDDMCSFTGSVVTFAAEGMCLVEAHQDADATHDAADAAQLVEVEAAPVAEPVAPTIAATLASTTPASHHWYRTPVTVTFRCTAGSSAVTACPSPVRLVRSAAGQSVFRQVVAADGGAASITVGPVAIDRAAPTVGVTGVRAGATYRGAGPRAHCHASDGVSGVARCSLTSTRHGHVVTVRAQAVDHAGNVAQRVVRYRVHVR